MKVGVEVLKIIQQKREIEVLQRQIRENARFRLTEGTSKAKTLLAGREIRHHLHIEIATKQSTKHH